MNKRLDSQSTVKDAKDFVLFYKYLSFDEDFGEDGEKLLMEIDIELDNLQEDELIPKALLQRLIKKFDAEYE